MPHILQMRLSARRLEITILSFTTPFQKLNETLYSTERKRRFVVCKHDRFAVLCFTVYGWKQKEIFICVYGQTGIVQISAVFLSLSSKTKACTTQELWNSKQCHFCTCGATINTKLKFLREALRKTLIFEFWKT